eukprot:2343699-Prymnesium_polylepis.1
MSEATGTRGARAPTKATRAGRIILRGAACGGGRVCAVPRVASGLNSSRVRGARRAPPTSKSSPESSCAVNDSAAPGANTLTSSGPRKGGKLTALAAASSSAACIEASRALSAACRQRGEWHNRHGSTASGTQPSRRRGPAVVGAREGCTSPHGRRMARGAGRERRGRRKAPHARAPPPLVTVLRVGKRSTPRQ